MEHDQRVCLRCGMPAGAQRFCESCCSQFGSLTGSVAYAGTESGHAVLFAGGAGGGGAGGKPPAPVDIGCDPPAQEGLTIDPQAGTRETTQPPRDVARFEEVLTPGQSELDRALAAFRKADAAGDPQGSVNLGVLLEQRGDLEGAIAAYRRADDRGDVNGSFNLGCLLADKGDLTGALAALRRADERGDGAAASNLGVLLERQGDRDAALAAYRRADERGDANGAFNLGLLLAGRGDLKGAKAAYRRAARRGDPDVQERVARAEADAQSAGPDAGPAAEAKASTVEETQAMEPRLVITTPQVPEPGPEADPGPNIAGDRTSDEALHEPEADPQRPERSGSIGTLDPVWTRRTTRPYWVAALCVLALLGVAAVVARRRRHRFR